MIPRLCASFFWTRQHVVSMCSNGKGTNSSECSSTYEKYCRVVGIIIDAFASSGFALLKHTGVRALLHIAHVQVTNAQGSSRGRGHPPHAICMYHAYVLQHRFVEQCALAELSCGWEPRPRRRGHRGHLGSTSQRMSNNKHSIGNAHYD